MSFTTVTSTMTNREPNGRRETLVASDLSRQGRGREQSQRSLRNGIPLLQHRQEILDKLTLQRKPQDRRRHSWQSHQLEFRRQYLKQRWRRSRQQLRSRHLRLRRTDKHLTDQHQQGLQVHLQRQWKALPDFHEQQMRANCQTKSHEKKCLGTKSGRR